MNATTTYLDLRSRSVVLVAEGEDLIARPVGRLTPELRAGIRGNRDQLMRDALYRLALSWINETIPSERQDRAFEILDDGLADVWRDKDLLIFRKFLREKLRGILQGEEEGAA